MYQCQYQLHQKHCIFMLPKLHFLGYSNGIFTLLLQTLRNSFCLATSSSILAKKFLRAFTLSCYFFVNFALLFDNGHSFWNPVAISDKLLFVSKSLLILLSSLFLLFVLLQCPT
jgi:hypothetical protein